MKRKRTSGRKKKREAGGEGDMKGWSRGREGRLRGEEGRERGKE